MRKICGNPEKNGVKISLKLIISAAKTCKHSEIPNKSQIQAPNLKEFKIFF